MMQLRQYNARFSALREHFLNRDVPLKAKVFLWWCRPAYNIHSKSVIQKVYIFPHQRNTCLICLDQASKVNDESMRHVVGNAVWDLSLTVRVSLVWRLDALRWLLASMCNRHTTHASASNGTPTSELGCVNTDSQLRRLKRGGYEPTQWKNVIIKTSGRMSMWSIQSKNINVFIKLNEIMPMWSCNPMEECQRNQCNRRISMSSNVNVIIKLNERMSMWSLNPIEECQCDH